MEEKKSGALFFSAVIGVARGLVGFPLEQPMESVKT
jgi:hypothetical protein